MSSVSSVFAPFAPTPAKIVVRIQNEGNPDDILTLDPDAYSSGFNVTFNQQTTLMKTTHWIDYDNVVEYLEAFFGSLAFDCDNKTCSFVQIEIPGLPCVLLKKKNLMAYLYGVVDDYLDQLKINEEWPVESVIGVNSK
jgi:hypothetical protein